MESISRNKEIISIKELELKEGVHSDTKYIFQIKKSVDGTINYYDGNSQMPFNGNPNNTRELDEAFFVHKRENANKILSILNSHTVGWEYILIHRTTLIKFK